MTEWLLCIGVIAVLATAVPYWIKIKRIEKENDKFLKL